MSKNNYECRYPACKCGSKENCIEDKKRRNDALIETKKAINGNE